jgi:hypothetical protein
MSVLNKVTNILIGSLVGTVLYGLTSIYLNTKVTFSLNYLSVEEAKNLIVHEQKNSKILNNKDINFIVLNPGLIPSNMGAFKFCSEGKYYLVNNGPKIKKTEFLHEIGHVLVSKPNTKKVSLEECITYINNFRSSENISAKDLLKYIYSPEEFFCNIYALSKK